MSRVGCTAAKWVRSVAFVALTLAAAGCGGGDDDGEQAATATVTGEFVGYVEHGVSSTGRKRIFFVAALAGAREGGDEREVRVYLCDGAKVNEWFTGSTAGNELALVSERGARLQGKLGSSAATGKIELEDGTAISFAAKRATGIAGLYNVTLSGDGRVTGSSESGAKMTGEIGEPVPNGARPASLTLTSPDGQQEKTNGFFSSGDPGEFRFVILAGGQMKGGKKRRFETDTGFMDPFPEP